MPDRFFRGSSRRKAGRSQGKYDSPWTDPISRFSEKPKRPKRGGRRK